MFGYVLPRRDKLSAPAAGRYRAAYCGLCRSLNLHYGFRARFLVNYDMTFLYFLLQSGQPQPCRCTCPTRPLCKRECLPDDDVMRYAADLSVLLSYWKLCDAERDGRFFHRTAAKCAKRLYRRAYRRAAERLPACDECFARRLSELHALEDAHCAGLDRPADAFASLLSACADTVAEESVRRPMQLLLYHVGRYLYLADALEDLPKDLRSGSYNPLRYRYALQDGALTAQDKAALLDTIEASVSMAASALELLPPTADHEIVHNIIYYGLSAVLHSVAEGTFRQKGTRK